MKAWLRFLVLGFVFSLIPVSGQASAPLDIPFTKYVLDNGLTLIVHEDHKAPIVGVNIWYHVGSKNEKPGKSGFAHLFEHLMFNGSENYNDDWFKATEKIGATDLNGTTNEDRTNYFQNVPTTALDTILWMESDRMGHFSNVITKERVDEQRGVVQNEKRQWDNHPYHGVTYERIARETYPKGHPYSWTVIGYMEDLDAATVKDAKDWFKTYYGAANAVITLAGDIKPKVALEKVKQYFGHIPSGPPIERPEVWVAKRTGEQRAIAQDRVPEARVMKIWNVPQIGTKDLAVIDLISDVLAMGKNSRLYKRLVHEEQIATSVSAYIDPKEIGSQFYLMANAKEGVDLSIVEKALDEELARLLQKGPSKKELSRVRTQTDANFARQAQRIGGFGGKSDILARSEVFLGSPDGYKQTWRYRQEATPKDLKHVGNKWLTDGVYVMEVHPLPSHKTTISKVDRSKNAATCFFPESGIS